MASQLAAGAALNRWLKEPLSPLLLLLLPLLALEALSLLPLEGFSLLVARRAVVTEELGGRTQVQCVAAPHEHPTLVERGEGEDRVKCSELLEARGWSWG